MKTSEGVKIVVLGGQLDESIVGGLSQEQYLPFHTVGDAKALHGANSADILLTACWPASIRNGSKVVIPSGPDAVLPPAGYQHISDLCAALKPRYHFSRSPSLYFEREPFFHNPSQDDPEFRPVTRFLSFAAHGNALKQKSLYAFSLSTLDKTAPMPSGSTASPFISSRPKRSLDPNPYSRFENHGRTGYRPNKHPKGRRGLKLPGPDECFFCLANETVSQHLVCSIGDHSYLTTAKGPLTTRETFSEAGINFPGHILIIPLAHSSTIALINEADNPNSKNETFEEMSRFRNSLQTMVAKTSGNKLGSVTYEISRAYGVHNQWQFVPLPEETIRKGLVEAAFKVEAENLRYPEFEFRDPGLGENEGDFFRVWIFTPPSEEGGEGSTKCLTMTFGDDLHFSLQFGRSVLAKLMQLEKRLQWRDCNQTEAEEVADVDAFKAAFADFDFS